MGNARRRHGRVGNARRRHGRVGNVRRRHCRVGHHVQRSGVGTRFVGEPLRDMEPQNRPSLVETGEERIATDGGTAACQPTGLAWRPLPVAAKLYVAAVIVIGFAEFVALFPHRFPQLLLFGILLLTSCLTSAWKVNLPITLVSGSTLSMSYAANLMSLLVLGPRHAMLIAVAGAWTQCTYKVKERYPL